MKTWNQVGVSSPLSGQSLSVLVFFVFAFEAFTTASSFSGSATWKTIPMDNNWNNPLNWDPETLPMNEGDIATFGASSVTDITTSAFVAVSSIVFEAGASALTITPAPATDGLEIFSPGIVNNSGLVQTFVSSVDEFGLGAVSFLDTATAGQNTVFISRATNATNGDTGIIEFLNTASAANGVYVNEGGQASGWVGGRTLFFGRSTADEATIIANGGMATGAGGGIIDFVGGACHAGNSTLIANGGSNGGEGGQIIFSDDTNGDSARVEVFGNGSLSFSSADKDVTVGSLEGDGLVFLGERSFTIGGNNLSTTFAGLMQDGTKGPGPLIKVGTGALALSGANTYTKSTIVNAGTLQVANTTGSGTGTGAVMVNEGILGGSGIIAGAVTIGTGSGTGAFLAPAAGGKKQLTLTIQSALTLNSDATYTYTFKATKSKARSDKVIANGVTINSGAMLNLSGQTQGSLRQGLTLTLISNTSANPISGTFGNLPDGAIVTVNGNNLQASYSGGDGNDLTLTVVP